MYPSSLKQAPWMKKERKNNATPISFDHDNVRVSGGNPEVFHSFKRSFYCFFLFVLFPDKFNSRWSIVFGSNNFTFVVISFLLLHCLHQGNPWDLNITVLVVFFFITTFTTPFLPSAISLFSSVYHRIRAGLRVFNINGYNRYWILYSTYIKFPLLFPFTPVY